MFEKVHGVKHYKEKCSLYFLQVGVHVPTSGHGIRKPSSQNTWNLPGKNPNTVFVTFNQVNEQLGILEDNPWHKPVISSAVWKVKVIFLRDILEWLRRVNFSSDCSSFKIKVKIFFYFTKMPLNSKTKYTVLFFNSFFPSPPLSLSPFLSLFFPSCPKASCSADGKGPLYLLSTGIWDIHYLYPVPNMLHKLSEQPDSRPVCCSISV